MLSEHQLKTAFGLTASEILLTLRLFGGETLREAARALGISYETARTKLKFIFQKTGTRRQAELILLLARYRAPAKSARRMAADRDGVKRRGSASTNASRRR
ncbi:MAG TPA: hypothetical protein VG986_05880 [Pseudolabrys sp.]|nr:hypothetical protein [Pseudolabrys sp.]